MTRESTSDAQRLRGKKRVVLPDSTFECHACGTCCRSFDVGPIPEARLESIAQHEWPDAVTRGEGAFFERSSGDDGRKPGIYFRQSAEGACVFLGADNLCEIHKRLGEEAKPWMCRAFPFTLVETPERVYFSVLPDSREFHATFRGTRPLDALRFDEMLSLLPHYEVHRFDPPTLRITPRCEVPISLYETLEAEMLSLVDRPGQTLGTALLALRDLSIAIVEAQDELVSGDSERLRAIARRPIRTDAPDASAFSQVLAGLVGSLGEGLDALMAQTTTRRERAVGDELLGIIARVNQRLRVGLPATLPADERGDALLRELARLFIFQKRYEKMGDLVSGLGFLTLNLSVARLAAPVDEGRPLDAEAIQRVAHRFNQFTRHRFVQPWLRSMAAPLRVLFTHHALL
ncbi:MAG: YkgJ family cysteine cluster protein [Myxococcales bacterium]|nr:YkgJ family cysteine cluster protein [Myxococcales bacterium]